MQREGRFDFTSVARGGGIGGTTHKAAEQAGAALGVLAVAPVHFAVQFGGQAFPEVRLGSAREGTEHVPLLGRDNPRGGVLLEVGGEVLVEGEQRFEVAGQAAQRLPLAVDHALARAPELPVAHVVAREVGLVVAGVLGELHVAVGEAEALAEAAEGDVADFRDGFGERRLLFERVEGGIFQGGAVGSRGGRERRVAAVVVVLFVVGCLLDTFVGFTARFLRVQGFFSCFFVFDHLIYKLRVFRLFRSNDIHLLTQRITRV